MASSATSGRCCGARCSWLRPSGRRLLSSSSLSEAVAAAAAASEAVAAAKIDAAAQPQVEYWFSTLSTYTYLSTMRIEQQAQARGVEVVWKPFNVR